MISFMLTSRQVALRIRNEIQTLVDAPCSRTCIASLVPRTSPFLGATYLEGRNFVLNISPRALVVSLAERRASRSLFHEADPARPHPLR